jgi:vancomycin resistance protein VanW
MFFRENEKNYRQNEIWRKTIDKKTGNCINEALLIKNFAEVKYEISLEKSSLC